MKLLGRVISSVSTIIGFLFTVTIIALQRGNLLDRFTNNLFVHSGSFFQAIAVESGTLSYFISAIIACAILIGPIDYFAGFNLFTMQPTIGGNMDLVISMLLLYFISAIMIGWVMRANGALGGFLLGFLTIFVLNMLVYITLHYTSVVLSYAIPELTPFADQISSIIDALLSGVYGEDTTAFIIRGTLLNGTVLGTFGAFFTAIFMPSKHKEIDIALECDPAKDFCYVPINETNN